MSEEYFPEGFPKPPWGITAIWGRRKVGKTVAGINSPWGPVHEIDVEFSAEDYSNQFPKLKKMGLFKHPFTRVSCLDYGEFVAELKRINEDPNLFYGTIVIDTIGQVTEWVRNHQFIKAGPKKAEKMSQVVWGDVRNDLRKLLLGLQKHCNLLLLLAHEREYNGVFSPRANPAILELASLSIRLTRSPNQKVPDGIVDIARLPFFPPRIPEFTIEKLLQYVDEPVDWDNLSEDEMIPDEAIVIPDEIGGDDGGE